MTATKFQDVIERGATFRREIGYEDSTGAAVSLAGYTAHWQVRDDAGVLVYDKTPTIDGSTVTLLLTAVETGTAPDGPLVYAVEVTAPGGEPVIRILEGTYRVSPEVVHD